MWTWIARHVTTSDAPAAERNKGSADGRAAKVPSKYASLHDYLVNRYADRPNLLARTVAFERRTESRRDSRSVQ
jgi:hypothetical protein